MLLCRSRSQTLAERFLHMSGSATFLKAVSLKSIDFDLKYNIFKVFFPEAPEKNSIYPISRFDLRTCKA